MIISKVNKPIWSASVTNQICTCKILNSNAFAAADCSRSRECMCADLMAKLVASEIVQQTCSYTIFGCLWKTAWPPKSVCVRYVQISRLERYSGCMICHPLIGDKTWRNKGIPKEDHFSFTTAFASSSFLFLRVVWKEGDKNGVCYSKQFAYRTSK